VLTSLGNYQAWIAISDPDDADFARRLRKEAETDLTASGAMRVAGSQNFTEKYAPSFLYVRIAHISPVISFAPRSLWFNEIN
jgi:hypothetical protein